MLGAPYTGLVIARGIEVNCRKRCADNGVNEMILGSIILTLSQVHDNTPYFFASPYCTAQGDGHQPIFIGIDKATCDDVAAVDRTLNNAYRRAISKLNAARKIRLRNEQRAWINSTNEKCDMGDDGVVWNYGASDCFIREARSRTAVLRRWGM